MYDYSILLPATGDGVEALRCIAAIAEQTDPALDYELVVADATGSAEFGAFLQSIEGAIKAVPARPEMGRAALVARAGAEASGRFLALLDQRLIVCEGWLNPHPTAPPGIAGCLVHAGVGVVVEAGLVFDGDRPAVVASILKTVDNAFLNQGPCPLPVAGRLAAVFPVELVRDVGWPDPAIDFEWAWADFCFKARARGYAVFLDPHRRAILEAPVWSPPEASARPHDFHHVAPDEAQRFGRRVALAMLEAGQIRFTGERALPEARNMDAAIMREHVARYAYVAQHLSGKSVLDAGCGSGYGAELLSAVAQRVVGIDRDAEAIAFCRTMRAAPNLEFLRVDAARTAFPDGSFDVVVSLETLDRVEKPNDFLKEACRLLPDTGELWVSAALDGPAHASPYRRTVYGRANLQKFLRGYFHEVIPAYQYGDQYAAEQGGPASSNGHGDGHGLMRCLRPKRFTPGPAAIVIPVFNEAGLTEQCIDSIRRNTPMPHQIIVVNNASSDGTAAYLAGQPDVLTTSNRENLGFGVAVNQGIRRSSGQYVVVLNNDTLVTPGWLEGLIAHAQLPGMGLVGAVSNFTAGLQVYDGLKYENTEEIESQAAALAREMSGQRYLVSKITGFCLLIRREVIQAIGGFDPIFGLGYCEDDDYSVRAGLAGFKIAVARDVYIHHFGSRSMAAANIDPQERIAANWQVFKRKWGLDYTGIGGIREEYARAFVDVLRRAYDFGACFEGSLWEVPAAEMAAEGPARPLIPVAGR